MITLHLTIGDALALVAVLACHRGTFAQRMATRIETLIDQAPRIEGSEA